jgi:hypothetical protein
MHFSDTLTHGGSVWLETKNKIYARPSLKRVQTCTDFQTESNKKAVMALSLDYGPFKQV